MQRRVLKKSSESRFSCSSRQRGSPFPNAAPYFDFRCAAPTEQRGTGELRVNKIGPPRLHKWKACAGALISCPGAGNITSGSSRTVRLHNQALPPSPDLRGRARHALEASSREREKKRAQGGNEMEAAVIHPQDIPLGQTVSARRRRLIALWAPEPIPCTGPLSPVRGSIRAMRRRRRAGRELFSRGWGGI